MDTKALTPGQNSPASTRTVTVENNSRKNLEVIENYLCADEDDRLMMPLSKKQKELLERWSYADEQLRKDRWKHTEILDMLMKRFNISENSARDDLRSAQMVFGSANALNKLYTSYAQVRRLENNIRVCIAAQNFKAAADFEKVLQKALQALPDNQAPKSPRQIVFNIANNNNTFTQSQQELDDAVKAAEELVNYEDIDFEELEDTNGEP